MQLIYTGLVAAQIKGNNNTVYDITSQGFMNMDLPPVSYNSIGTLSYHSRQSREAANTRNLLKNQLITSPTTEISQWSSVRYKAQTFTQQSTNNIT